MYWDNLLRGKTLPDEVICSTVFHAQLEAFPDSVEIVAPESDAVSFVVAWLAAYVVEGLNLAIWY